MDIKSALAYIGVSATTRSEPEKQKSKHLGYHRSMPVEALHSGCLKPRQSIASLPLMRLHSAQSSCRLS